MNNKFLGDVKGKTIYLNITNDKVCIYSFDNPDINFEGSVEEFLVYLDLLNEFRELAISKV